MGGKMISEEVFWRQNGFLGWPLGCLGEAGCPSGLLGLPEGLLVDLGSPLRSSVGPWVVFEGQLDTLFRFKVPLACFWEIDVPRTREAHFRGHALQSGWKTPSRSNLRDGVGFCSIGKKLAPIQRLLLERRWHPGGWPRPRK